MAVLEEGMAGNWDAERASQAMESAACFVNQLRELEKQFTTPTIEAGISLENVRTCLKKYTNKRKTRTRPILKTANMACQCLLKTGPTSKGHVTKLPSMTGEEFICPKSLDLCLAEKLENWPWDSDRVKFYEKPVDRMN
ncbi:hypothetical protein TSTA_097120 [Talaromyces stipitatus ATCC 10500]|uniref:Uncharacterized protein n=1 Tax=Talaromyces stipitatus (strain ATCC 10500 / CBS 375.48 / QM 6759 / NRRL 1006) TaxID=441959 RepID=B8LZP0_TALSN|nr:uncharacterized protein TSTA_097120 [Talaromyces stipitatus ATCC 10500]EED22463.1 hypothetical protein TSTA_097120 [Talaromyces stipitatus ATCC 10500]